MGSSMGVRLDAAGEILWQSKIDVDDPPQVLFHTDDDWTLYGSMPLPPGATRSADRVPWLLKLDPWGSSEPGCPSVITTSTTVMEYAASGRPAALPMRPGSWEPMSDE